MNELQVYSSDIAKLHQQAQQHAESAIQCAMQAGQLLVKAKADSKHGEWLLFVESTGLSARTAQKYMQLATNADKLKYAEGAHLSINRALEYLAEPDDKERLDNLERKIASALGGRTVEAIADEMRECLSELKESSTPNYDAAVNAVKECHAWILSLDKDDLTLDQWAEIAGSNDLEENLARIKLRAYRGIERIRIGLGE